MIALLILQALVAYSMRQQRGVGEERPGTCVGVKVKFRRKPEPPSVQPDGVSAIDPLIGWLVCKIHGSAEEKVRLPGVWKRPFPENASRKLDVTLPPEQITSSPQFGSKLVQIILWPSGTSPAHENPAPAATGIAARAVTTIADKRSERTVMAVASIFLTECLSTSPAHDIMTSNDGEMPRASRPLKQQNEGRGDSKHG